MVVTDPEGVHGVVPVASVERRKASGEGGMDAAAEAAALAAMLSIHVLSRGTCFCCCRAARLRCRIASVRDAPEAARTSASTASVTSAAGTRRGEGVGGNPWLSVTSAAAAESRRTARFV